MTIYKNGFHLHFNVYQLMIDISQKHNCNVSINILPGNRDGEKWRPPIECRIIWYRLKGYSGNYKGTHPNHVDVSIVVGVWSCQNNQESQITALKALGCASYINTTWGYLSGLANLQMSQLVPDLVLLECSSLSLGLSTSFSFYPVTLPLHLLSSYFPDLDFLSYLVAYSLALVIFLPPLPQKQTYGP